jgi:hypothetical protein
MLTSGQHFVDRYGSRSGVIGVAKKSKKAKKKGKKSKKK